MAEFKHSLGFNIPSENTVNPTDKYKSGFTAGYTLPAPHFNWIVDKTTKSIKELQDCFNVMVDGKFTEGTSVPIKSGGTGARNRKDAMVNIAFLGIDPITETSDDTPQKWISLGTGYAWVSPNGKITDRPTDYAIVVNVVHSGDLTQFWIAQPIGRVYKRSGSTAGWNGTWFKSYDEKNKPTPNELGVESLSGGTAIQANTDLNTLKTMGNYHCDNDTRVGTLTNCPVKNAFRMKVGNPTGSTSYVYQEIYHYMSGARYYRQCLASGNNWTEWVKTYDTSNKPTPAEIGAVPTGYGFAETAKDISNGYLVNVLTNGKSGFYMGVNVTGAPHPEDWWIFEVICHNAKFSSVMAYSVNGTDVFRMSYINNVFGAWHKVFTSADILEIKNGGTGGATVPDARQKLNFISSTYTGTGDSSSGSRMYNFDTGARGSNVIFIANDVSKGFLTPKGGVMFKDSGRSVTAIGVYEVFGGNAESKAYYSDGYIQLRTNHDFINFNGGVYHYWCL